MTKHLYFYHGFLGEPEDWNAVTSLLSPHFSFEHIDLNHSDPFHYAEKHLTKPDCILVGYSLGGRLAWRLANKHFSKVRGLVVIGAHPGLKSAKDKQDRLVADQKWISLLEAEDMEIFLQTWYQQPLFHSLKQHETLFQELLEKRKKRDPLVLASILQNMSLGSQDFLHVKIPTLFLHGVHDEKYASLYSDYACVGAIENAGHAAHLENPLAVAKAIEHFVETCL